MTKRMFAKLRLLCHFVPRNDSAEFLVLPIPSPLLQIIRPASFPRLSGFS